MLSTATILPGVLAAIVASAAALPSRALAGPAEYMYSPIVESGERELELKFGRAALDHGADAAAGISYGGSVSEHWFAAIVANWNRKAGSGAKFDAVEFENVFQLTETGEYPVDVGMLVELEVPRQRDDAREVIIGPLLRTQGGRVQYNLNLLLERTFGGRLPAGEQHDTVLRYQAAVKYRLREQFEFGVQALGETGTWNDWSAARAQDHRIGPMIYGRMPLGGRRKLVYDLAWLVGATRATADHVLRMKLELEF